MPRDDFGPPEPLEGFGSPEPLGGPRQAPAGGPAVGPGETFLNKAVNSIPGGKAITDSASALLMRAFGPGPGAELTPQAEAQLRALGRAPQPAPTLGDIYRAMRDRRIERTAAGAQQNPWAARLGSATGIGLSLAAPLPAVGALGEGAMLGKVLPGMLTGAGYGAEMMLEHGSADLTKGEFGKAATEAAPGALFGGVLGGAIPAAVQAGGALAPRLAPFLERLGINQGRRVLTNGADSLSKNLPISDDAVLAAKDAGAFGFLGSNARALNKLNSATEHAGDQYGDIVRALEAEGVHGPDALQLAEQLTKRGEDVFQKTADPDLQRVYTSKADDILGAAGNSNELGLTQAEGIKRALQRKAKYGKFDETPLNEERRSMASMVRQAVEDTIGQQTAGRPELEDLASQFVPAKQTLGSLLDAEAAATRGASREAQRGHFSLKDSIHAGAAIASGHGAWAAPIALGSNLLGRRGPSTVASGAFRLADLLRGSQSANATPAARRFAMLLGDYLSPESTPGFGYELRSPLFGSAQ